MSELQTNPYRELINRFRDHAGVDPSVPDDADALLGFFQTYRPDGLALGNLFDGLPHRAELSRRIDQLFAAAGEDRRPQGGRDAYFVVRKYEMISARRVEILAGDWCGRLASLGRELGHPSDAERFDPPPTVRVLEGIPPKHPKKDQGRTGILQTLLEKVPDWTAEIAVPGDAAIAGNWMADADQLRRVFYFIACDPYLRDYLMWPLYADAIQTVEPFEPYFELWRHRVKFRSFKEGQLDWYLPISTGLGSADPPKIPQAD